MESVYEYISNNIPYAKQVHAHFAKYRVYVDTRDETILSNLKLAYRMSQDGCSAEDILKSLSKRDVSVGSHVFCSDDGYGLGRITQEYSKGFGFVMFEKRTLPVMCKLDGLVTVHDDKHRKLKLIY